MLRTNEKDFALLYFENRSALPALNGFKPNTSYALLWFNPLTGKWKKRITIKSDAKGILAITGFPDEKREGANDWAAKIVEIH